MKARLILYVNLIDYSKVLYTLQRMGVKFGVLS